MRREYPAVPELGEEGGESGRMIAHVSSPLNIHTVLKLIQFEKKDGGIQGFNGELVLPHPRPFDNPSASSGQASAVITLRSSLPTATANCRCCFPQSQVPSLKHQSTRATSLKPQSTPDFVEAPGKSGKTIPPAGSAVKVPPSASIQSPVRGLNQLALYTPLGSAPDKVA